jgi:SAM-dependent methyltransferase
MDHAPSDAPWWALRYEALAALDPALVGVGDHRAEAEAEFVERLGELGPRARVLDVGCGLGRHATALSARGHAVTGIDLSPRVLRLARERWERRAAGARGPTWMPGDMRWLPNIGVSDAVVLLGGAFGLFDTDAEHMQVLTGAAQHLRPGGTLVLQTPNPYHWAGRTGAQYVPPGAMAEGIDVVQNVRFDALTGRLDERTLCFGRGQRVEPPPQSLRAYTPPELSALLLAAGFRSVEVSGTEGWAVPDEPLPVDATDSVWLWVSART